MVELTTDYVKVELKQEVEKWGNDFTVYWTLSVAFDAVEINKGNYKRRVVGPNGEVCRSEELHASDISPGVRKAFRQKLETVMEEA